MKKIPEFQESLSLLDSFDKTLLVGWLMVMLFVVLNVCGALLLKIQVQTLEMTHANSLSQMIQIVFRFVFMWKTLLAIGCLVFATCAWTIALRHLELSRACPVALGLNLLIVFLSAIFIFHEPITVKKIIGSILILSGVVLLT